jgi:probable HAF family extracellular repeat protein
MKLKSPLFFLALLTALPPAFGQQATTNSSYYVINLGTPLGGNLGFAAGASASGSIAGYANLTGNTAQHAVLWYANTTKDLGTLGGSNSALLNQFSGFSENSTTDPLGQDYCGTSTGLICLPITATSGKAVQLPLLGGYNGAGFGNNDLGQVAGVAQTTYQDPRCLVNGQPVKPFAQVQQAVPVVWTNGSIRQLPLYSGDSEGSANAINNLGQATGTTGDCVKAPTAHGVVWLNGQPVNLGNLGGALNTNPFAINDLTQITGTSDIAGDQTSHAFLWQNGKMQDLGTLPGDTYSVGYSINNFGQIVGQSCNASNQCRAFFWQKGTMTDLNSLVPANSPLYLYLAAAIDEFGVIAGYAIDQSASNSPAFVAVPELFGLSPTESSAARNNPAVPRMALPETVRAQMRQDLRTRGVQRSGPAKQSVLPPAQ